MTAAGQLDDALVRKHLLAESNAALAMGGLIAAALGGVGTLVLVGMSWSGAARDLQVPTLFSLCAGGYSMLIWALARRQRIDGALLYAVLLPFVSLPTLFFVLSHFLMPAGAATYLTGPISYLYGFLIILTGLLFRPLLAVAAGAICSAGYLFSYLLAQPHLATVRSADPTLTQDLSTAPIYIVKGLIIFFLGLGVALISHIAQRLIRKVLAEERQKSAISRLFGQYVSDEVKDRIVAEKAETIGERKRVVVLFSDLRGFSTYSEGRAPEEIVVHLNEYFEAMVQAISAEGGVIDKFIGDAVMAVFGGVIDLDNAAAAAVRAARGMRTRLAALNARWGGDGRDAFDNGIGMHYGEVLQGSIGSSSRKEFTVIGDAVNTASRLEGCTKDFAEKILITAALYEALPDELRGWCTPHGSVTVKGKREQLSVYGVADAG